MKSSLIRWAGSKKKLVSKLKPFWEASSCERYIEPFAGSAVLFFAVEPKKAILADANQELIDTYLAVQNNWKLVFHHLSKFPSSKEFYYSLRAIDCSKRTQAYRAARFLYLNRFCFNGLYRTNARGVFNVPYANDEGRMCQSKEELENFSRQVADVNFLHQDFRETLKMAKKGDFVYADPPYAIQNKRIFNQYGPTTFGLNDLRDLATQLHGLNDKGVKFLVSYAYSRETLDVFHDWYIKAATVQRTVAGNPLKRRRVREMFVTNIER